MASHAIFIGYRRNDSDQEGVPVVFRQAGARFYFYSNEGSPREPVHIHVEKGDGEAKLWLWPEVSVADSHALSRRERPNWCVSLKHGVKRSRGHGMTISAEAVRVDDDTLWVDLADGRSIGAPLAWFPRLLRASPAQRANVRIGAAGKGLHGTIWTKTFPSRACWRGEAIRPATRSKRSNAASPSP